MEFSQILAGVAAGDPIELTPDWLQGRTAYGGLSAAISLAAAEATFPGLPPLRSAQFAFIGPASGRLEPQPTLLRQGKSSAFVGVDLLGEAGLACRAVFCFAAARASRHDRADLPRPAVAGPPEACGPFFRQTGAPSFSQHFDTRLAGGGRPVSGGGEPETRVWLRHRDPQAADGVVALLALADAIPPAAMILFPEPAPISTMTWSLDVLAEAPASDDGWWLLQSIAETVRSGYSAQAMTVWGRGGAPVIAARQTVAVFS